MKMKKSILLMCMAVCCYAMAQTNTFSELVSEMPIAFEPENFKFSRDVNETSSSVEDVNKTVESKEKTSDSQKTSKTLKVDASASAGVSHEMTAHTFSAKAAAGFAGGSAGGMMLGPIPLGSAFGGFGGVGLGAGGAVASSKTQIDLKAKLSASTSMEKSQLSEREMEEIQKIKSTIRGTTTRSTKNWKFKVQGHFVNRTAHRYVCRDINEAKIDVECMGQKIPVKYSGTSLEVLDGDTDKGAEFESEVTDEDQLALLQWMKENQRLDKQHFVVKIGADFPLYEVSGDGDAGVEKKLAFHSQEKSPISVDVRFGDFREKFPLSVKRFVQSDKMDRRELTVKEVLIAVSEYVYQKNKGSILNRERVFSFGEMGLARVFDVPVGKMFIGENEASAYKMLMMRIGRKWVSKVDDTVLSTLLNGDEVSRSIVFDMIGDVDIAANLNEFSEEVKNDYIDQITKLEVSKKSKRGQGALVYLYWDAGNKKKMVEHLASMGDVGLDLTMIGNDGNPLFWKIILEGDVGDAKKIVASGRGIVDAANKQANAEGQTILSMVIKNDDLGKYKVLTESGINRIKGGQTKHIFYAAECGSSNIVRWLVKDANKSDREAVDALDDKKWSPLMYAVKNGHLELSKFLVDQGADVERKLDKTDVMCDDTENNYRLTRNYIKAMRDFKKCQQGWFGVAPDYDVEKIHDFLDAGVDVDYRWNFKSHNQWRSSDYGWTFLRWAVDNNEADLVRELVRRGSLVSDECHRHDGMLPLEYAVKNYLNSKKVGINFADASLPTLAFIKTAIHALKSNSPDWATVDELLRAEDACICGFKDKSNALIAAERALFTIHDHAKLNKLQVEKALADCKNYFLKIVEGGNISDVKKLLPMIEDLRKDWIADALSQKETSKKVREYLQQIGHNKDDSTSN